MGMKVLDFLAVGFCLGLAINLTIIFFLALFNGGQVMVVSNMFGEQWYEAVLYPVWIVMGIIAFIRLGRRL